VRNVFHTMPVMLSFVPIANIVTVYKSIMTGDFAFCYHRPVLIHMDQGIGNGVVNTSLVILHCVTVYWKARSYDFSLSLYSWSCG
jgi:hypothetical protein